MAKSETRGTEALKPHEHFTYRQYRSWPEGEHWIVNPDTLETFMNRLSDARYGLPTVTDLLQPTPVGIFPGLELRAR